MSGWGMPLTVTRGGGEKGTIWNLKKQGGKRGALLPFSQLAACPPPDPELPAYQAVAQPSLPPSKQLLQQVFLLRKVYLVVGLCAFSIGSQNRPEKHTKGKSQ